MEVKLVYQPKGRIQTVDIWERDAVDSIWN